MWHDFPRLTTLPTARGPADHDRTHRQQLWHPSPRARDHHSLNPFLTGGGALFVLLLLLWVITRFNRDR